jgi:hypothetical protein
MIEVSKLKVELNSLKNDNNLKTKQIEILKQDDKKLVH